MFVQTICGDLLNLACVEKITVREEKEDVYRRHAHLVRASKQISSGDKVMEEKKDVKDLVEELHNLGVAVAVFTGEDFINLSELEGDADEAEEWILDNRRRLEEAMWGGAEDLYRYCKAVE